jgi:hypothetical protein
MMVIGAFSRNEIENPTIRKNSIEFAALCRAADAAEKRGSGARFGISGAISHHGKFFDREQGCASSRRAGR